MSANDLLDALCARRGIVCAVGAGGKKTTLYRLLRTHPGRVACTATVFTQVYPPDLPAHQVVAAPADVVAAVLVAAPVHAKLAFACPSSKPQRNAGLTPEQVAECHARGGFDVTLVKADGARMRPLKAPSEREPNLVSGTTTVLGL
ncbi:MAG TPA: selenium cofactor biosynthesis protein YqeC, partial [Nevskiaceae bacterium]|nr:selenium cofactor biosynthesis protein YqeC [Nevskiaceae bacterium]